MGEKNDILHEKSFKTPHQKVITPYDTTTNNFYKKSGILLTKGEKHGIIIVESNEEQKTTKNAKDSCSVGKKV